VRRGACFVKRSEVLHIQEFLEKSTVETFDEGVLGGFSRLDELQ
jgi:hypothetical protein